MRLEQRELELRVRSSPLWVRSDAQLLQRLLGNLVDNALKYTERGGEIAMPAATFNAVDADRLWTSSPPARAG